MKIHFNPNKKRVLTALPDSEGFFYVCLLENFIPIVGTSAGI